MEAVACWLARLVANGVVLIAVVVLAIPGLAGAVPKESPASWGLVLLKKRNETGLSC